MVFGWVVSTAIAKGAGAVTKTLWKLTDVNLEGSGGRSRLGGLSLEIPSGSTAVIGASGAGKTSLLNLLVDFERPSRGDILTNIEGAAGLPVFWVPQNAGLWSHLSAREHLSVVSGNESDCKSLLADFDLTDHQDALPDSLSAGQRGRLALARALASNANVLVMDEPLANVDTTSARRYWQIIRERMAGKSLVFATHAVDTVLREADHVICLHKGKLRYAGEKQSLYDTPQSPELAELLGPINWFEPNETQRWIEGDSQERQCYRPEHLKVVPSDDSPIRIQKSRYGAAVGELEIVDERSDMQRTVYHRMNGRRFQAGDRIILRVLSMILLMCCAVAFLPGCTSSKSAPKLNATEVNHWSIPPAGKVIPAPRSVRFSPDGEVYVLDNAGPRVGLCARR